MKQINIRVTDELHRVIKTKASSEGKTITAVVKELLKRWAEEMDDEETEED